LKPRTIAGLISRISKSDARYSDLEVHRRDSYSTLSVIVTSATANVDLKEEIEYPLVRAKRGDGWYFLEWDISEMGKPVEKDVKPYCFTEGARQVRRKVTSQEDDAADVIGGKRHLGSGAISGLKSDASSMGWQLEAKMATRRQSISVSVEWLSKITYEASVVNKKPILYLTFGNIPSDKRMEDTWVVIPKSIFERINVG
jgi:hypothetical protein